MQVSESTRDDHPPGFWLAQQLDCNMAEHRWRGNGGSHNRERKHGMTQYADADRSDNSGRVNVIAAMPVSLSGSSSSSRVFTTAFTIGRSRRCEVVIPTSDDTRTISKIHARIFPMRSMDTASSPSRSRAQKWLLQDLNTLNGTAINDMDMLPGGSMELHNGDEIVLSSTMRNGVRLSILFPDDDRCRILIKVHGPNASPRRATFGEAPSWLAVPPSPFVGRDTTPRPSPPPPPSTASKRPRSSEHNTPTHRTSLDAPHDTKRSRVDDSDDKERFMVCSVCLDYFYNSATLTCSHTFCGHCIGHWFRTSALLSCPECRAAVKHVPVRNRALDDLVHKLVGDSDSYRAIARKRTTMERQSLTSGDNGFDLRTHPLVFSRWCREQSLEFQAFINTQFGDGRVTACRQIGLTEAAIDGASATELLVAAQNLLIDCMSLRAFHEASERLKIYLHYG